MNPAPLAWRVSAEERKGARLRRVRLAGAGLIFLGDCASGLEEVGEVGLGCVRGTPAVREIWGEATLQKGDEVREGQGLPSRRSLASQVWVMREAGIDLRRAAIHHIDTGSSGISCAGGHNG